jgi:catechol 2,3-dioxygenase-like lactoylglutathione lyase family enzyme
MFKGLDHLAIVVPDTEEALRIWRDRWETRADSAR